MNSVLLLLENHSKANRRMTETTLHNWAPTYAPPLNVSPKLYKLVRNVRTSSVDQRLSFPIPEYNEDLVENDIFSISNRMDFVRVRISFRNQIYFFSIILAIRNLLSYETKS